MMPGPHIPPAIPSRRQNDYAYHLPQQAHSPVHNPYAPYPPPPYHGHPHAPHYPPQWYQPYPQHPQHYPQHPPPPRPYIPPQPQLPPQGPIIVSSNPHAQPIPQMTRAREKTPPAERPYPPPPVPQQELPPPPVVQHQAPQTETPASPATPATATSISMPPRPTSSRPSVSSNSAPLQPPPPPARRIPFYPPLPWLSVPDQPFPAPSRARRRRRGTQRSSVPLELPDLSLHGAEDLREESGRQLEDTIPAVPEQIQKGEEQVEAQSTVALPSDQETPITSEAPSEADSTHPTTPSSAVPQQTTPRQASHGRTTAKPAVPLIPIKPVVPNISPTQRKSSAPSAKSVADKEATPAVQSPPSDTTQGPETLKPSPAAETTTAPPPKPAPPKSWAELLRSNKPAAAPTTVAATTSSNGVIAGKAASMGDVLRSYNVDSDSKIAFIEPRGLVNTGNMCYMNSILQILVFCVPFYDFLDQVGKRAAHSFKSDTPLLDAMIMFMREFSIIDAVASVEQLRMRLKDNELEQYGDAFIPEYVYDVIRRLPRFSTMRRGHQQDAEEFLGFLLEGLHDECVQVLSSSNPSAFETIDVTSPRSERSASTIEGGWMEVGPKQKAAVTRSSGHVVSDSPITKIFGGNLRSELRVPGLKNSVTLEPYQPLQLDIGSPTVNNITDALKGLTRSETLQGDFNSPRGPGTSATKQVFIETLPPVLILHLKRFQYDNTGGTQKIWKRVGYPLELEIPKEVFTPSKRSKLSIGGSLPHYRLTSVVYHHGKNASGGHYTVDVRRQEGREWIRLDDTVIRRVRSEDVAEGGAEEDPKVLAAALENHKRDVQSGNIFDRFGIDDEEKEGEQGWSQVNGAQAAGAAATAKKWSGVVNGTNTGTATPSTKGERTPKGRELKADRVAYILIYQQIK